MIDDSWYQRPPGMPAHDAAGGVIVRVRDGKVYVAAVGEEGLNSYILPKGHVEEGEDPELAARREIEEEAGLRDLELLGELGIRERMDFRKTGWKRTHYYLYATRQTRGTPTDEKHAYYLAWFPLDQPVPLFWPEQVELVESNRPRILDLLRQHGYRVT